MKLADLANRLNMNHGDNLDCKHVDILRRSLQEMLSQCPTHGRIPYLMDIGGYFETANASSDLAAVDTCRSALLEEFIGIVQCIKANEFRVVEVENYDSEVAWSDRLCWNLSSHGRYFHMKKIRSVS